MTEASGVVELPHHVCWSGDARSCDLSVRDDRRRVYEMVLREGTVEDIRRYITVDDLLDLWDELVLPLPVRQAWSQWLQEHGRSVTGC
mgnify:FL=1